MEGESDTTKKTTEYIMPEATEPRTVFPIYIVIIGTIVAVVLAVLVGIGVWLLSGVSNPESTGSDEVMGSKEIDEKESGGSEITGSLDMLRNRPQSLESRTAHSLEQLREGPMSTSIANESILQALDTLR